MAAMTPLVLLLIPVDLQGIMRITNGSTIKAET